MNRIVVTILVIALALLLSSCGIIRAIAPDPAGSLELEGKTAKTTVALREPLTPEFTAGTNPETGDLIINITDNVDPAPRGLKPRYFTETIGFHSDVTVTPNPDYIPEGASADNVLPDTLTLTEATIIITTYDGTGEIPTPTGPISMVLQNAYSSGSISLELQKGACDALSCTYTFVDTDAIEDVIIVEVTNDVREVDLGDSVILVEPYNSLYEIRTAGEAQNTSIVALQVALTGSDVTKPVIPGSFIEFEFTTKDGRSVL